MFDQSYQYSVVAENSVGGAAQTNAPTATTVPVGVDLIIGTNNRRFDAANGTILLACFVFPESVPTGCASIQTSLSGPGGWNDDRELTFTIPENFDERLRSFVFGSYNGITAINGSYQLVAPVAGTTY